MLIKEPAGNLAAPQACLISALSPVIAMAHTTTANAYVFQGVCVLKDQTANVLMLASLRDRECIICIELCNRHSTLLLL